MVIRIMTSGTKILGFELIAVCILDASKNLVTDEVIAFQRIAFQFLRFVR